MSIQPAPLIRAHTQIAALFPYEVSVSAMASDCVTTGLQEIVQRRAARRREFIRGRLCARRALAGLGVFGAAVERQVNGAPLWPRGVVGSISHTSDLCAAVVARRGAAQSLGLDVERSSAAAPELGTLILAPDEEAPVNLFGADNGLTALFSAKEAFYKCHFPVHRRFLDFRDWRAAFHVRGKRFGAFTMTPACCADAPFFGAGFWSFDETHIYTGFSTPARFN